MASLYEVSSQYAALMSEDLPPEMIADTLEGIEGEFTDKVSAILALCKNESAYADSLKEESSPRPWGCFCTSMVCSGRSSVFPTPVGVFPDKKL